MLTFMVWQTLRKLRRHAPTAADYQVVRRQPVRRGLTAVAVALVVLGGVAFGYWLGLGVSDLDRTYLSSLTVRHQASEAQVTALNRELADLRLAQAVDAQAARSLRQTITELRGELAKLNDEVAFYRSLMAPASVERGLQVAEFQLAAAKDDNKFTYQILLTQVAERRNWLQGRLTLQVTGQRTDADGSTSQAVLPLTELAEVETYPLSFRFRYFQDLAGILTLPAGFEPRMVTIAATPAGGNSVERQFAWSVQAD